MIVDRIDNADAYGRLGGGIAAAMEYLQKTDFASLDSGRQELDGERLFAMVQRYRTKSQAQAAWEVHRQYIDVQYVVEGIERMGWAPLALGPPVVKAYDAESDAALHDADGDFVTLAAGSFAILTPQDIHAPQVAAGSPPVPSPVLKVVVKVRIDEASGPCGF